MLKHSIKLLRIEHWVKNLFVFIPAFFGAVLFRKDNFVAACIGFLAFSLIASAVYVLNDLMDVDQDKNHPDKRKRPLASGALSKQVAYGLLFCCLGLGLGIGFLKNTDFFLVCLAYFGINIFYSAWLKQIAIVDVSIIALGFLLRIFAGGAITHTPVSNWLIVLTFLLALILGLAKRRGEYLTEAENSSFRKALDGYNLPFLDASIVVCSTVSIVAYLMYCFSPEVVDRIGSERIYFTAFFVIIGVLRYLQLTLVFNRTESPTRALLHDGFLQLVLLGWIAAFFWLLYRPLSHF